MKKFYSFLICSLFLAFRLCAVETDYTKGLSIWFDTPNTLQGYAVWYGGDRICGKVVINRKLQEIQVIIRIPLGNRNHYR